MHAFLCTFVIFSLSGPSGTSPPTVAGRQPLAGRLDACAHHMHRASAYSSRGQGAVYVYLYMSIYVFIYVYLKDFGNGFCLFSSSCCCSPCFSIHSLKFAALIKRAPWRTMRSFLRVLQASKWVPCVFPLLMPFSVSFFRFFHFLILILALVVSSLLLFFWHWLFLISPVGLSGTNDILPAQRISSEAIDVARAIAGSHSLGNNSTVPASCVLFGSCMLTKRKK